MDGIGFASGTTNLYGYAGNNPISNVDPSGNYVESPWDLFSLGVGVTSLAWNLRYGTWWDVGLDTLGVVADVGALLLPGIPGGVSAGINTSRLAKFSARAVQTVNTWGYIKRGTQIVQASKTLQYGIYGLRAANYGANIYQAGNSSFASVRAFRNGDWWGGTTQLVGAGFGVLGVTSGALGDLARFRRGASRVPLTGRAADIEIAPNNPVPPSANFFVNEHGVAYSKRAYELGLDPKTGFRPNEGLGGSRLERQIGRPVERYVQDADFDFIDKGELGGRISLKGPLVGRDGRLLPANVIDKQLNSLVDKVLRDAHPTSGATAVAVDLFGLTPQQITQVKTAISKGLPPNANRIVYIK